MLSLSFSSSIVDSVVRLTDNKNDSSFRKLFVPSQVINRVNTATTINKYLHGFKNSPRKGTTNNSEPFAGTKSFSNSWERELTHNATFDVLKTVRQLIFFKLAFEKDPRRCRRSHSLDSKAFNN
jgi:hypothetical protein